MIDIGASSRPLGAKNDRHGALGMLEPLHHLCPGYVVGIAGTSLVPSRDPLADAPTLTAHHVPEAKRSLHIHAFEAFGAPAYTDLCFATLSWDG